MFRIGLRAFQGLSGAGAYAVALTSFFELVPLSKMPLNTTIITLIYVLSQVAGPLLGGAINRSSGVGSENNWRWVFLLKYAYLPRDTSKKQSNNQQCPRWLGHLYSLALGHA